MARTAITVHYGSRTVSTVDTGTLTVEQWLRENGLPVRGTYGLDLKVWVWDETLDFWMPQCAAHPDGCAR